jgi:hypothetical protein
LQAKSCNFLAKDVFSWHVLCWPIGDGVPDRAYRIRLIAEVLRDKALAHLRRRDDSKMLETFLERLESLGWWPPDNDERRAHVEANEFLVFEDSEEIMYAFRLRGGRGEREPELLLFFWYDAKNRTAYVVHVVETVYFDRARRSVIKTAFGRANMHRIALRMKVRP